MSLDRLKILQDGIEMAIRVVERSKSREEALVKLKLIHTYIVERKIDRIKEEMAILI